LSKFEVENLLSGFLAGTLCLKLETRTSDIGELPLACRTLVLTAQRAGRVWTAWSTPCGPVAAWADYDINGSKRTQAYVLFVEWWHESNGHHSLWCYCYPKRPKEWTFGRGRNNEPR
jgi:hypothetical protein